jgi:hypothetical protein
VAMSRASSRLVLERQEIKKTFIKPSHAMFKSKQLAETIFLLKGVSLSSEELKTVLD